jgi:hypothetical protein
MAVLSVCVFINEVIFCFVYGCVIINTLRLTFIVFTTGFHIQKNYVLLTKHISVLRLFLLEELTGRLQSSPLLRPVFTVPCQSSSNSAGRGNLFAGDGRSELGNICVQELEENESAGRERNPQRPSYFSGLSILRYL